MQHRFILLFSLALGLGAALPATAQNAAAARHPDVPAALDVAGLHLVLDDEARRLVQQKADALCRHQPSFRARVVLADAAFPLIDQVLQQEGVPLDFRYLAMQESALQGDAQSNHGAVGYWQLKVETATELGLVVNSAVDERQHLTASTRAAARYLARNNAWLHNWLNTMLSYYTGLSGVKPYVLPTDADATTLNITAQTAPYVLMFLAQKIAFEPAVGLNPRPPLRLREFPAQAGQTLVAQAQTLGTDPAALATHNHWLLAAAVPADRPYTLLVPVTDAAQVAGLVQNQRLNAPRDLNAAPAAGKQSRAEVQVNGLRALIALPNESLADLAARGHQKIQLFRRHNELRAFDQAVSGRPYYLESKRDAAAVDYHVLQPGETLADVAQRYGVREHALLAKNHLHPRETLKPGRLLWLRHTRPHEVDVEYRDLAASAGAAPAGSSAPLQAAPAVATAAPTSDEATENLNELPPPAGAAPVALEAPVVLTEPEPEPVPRLPSPPRPAPDPRAVVAPRPVVVPVAAPPVAVAKPVPARASVSGSVSVPNPAPAAPAVPTAPAAEAPAVVPVPASGWYTVQPRETVYALGRRYGLRPSDLLAWNNLLPDTRLVSGQVLRLTAPVAAPAAAVAPGPLARPAPAGNAAGAGPGAKTGGAAGAPGPRQHTVAKGETFYSIARRYALTPAQLQQYNACQTLDLRVGEVLRLVPAE